MVQRTRCGGSVAVWRYTPWHGALVSANQATGGEPGGGDNLCDVIQYTLCLRGWRWGVMVHWGDGGFGWVCVLFTYASLEYIEDIRV